MPPSRKLARRRFLESAVATSAAAGCTRRVALSFLSDAEFATLTAVCDQMIPPDQDPGGGWAGAADYIDRQLRGHFREHLHAYHAGLAVVERRAGGRFASLPRERQLELLTRMDRDPATRGFIALVATHAMQGFYGSPRHGGNRDYCSWRMLGVPASPVRGRDPYDFTKGGA
jgi:gluconate 2-dehydrogenase gamma chain